MGNMQVEDMLAAAGIPRANTPTVAYELHESHRVRLLGAAACHTCRRHSLSHEVRSTALLVWKALGGGRGGADGEQGTVTGRGFMQSDGGGGRGSLRGTEWVLEDIEGVVLFVQKVEIENKEALTNGTAGDKGDRGNT